MLTYDYKFYVISVDAEMVEVSNEQYWLDIGRVVIQCK